MFQRYQCFLPYRIFGTTAEDAFCRTGTETQGPVSSTKNKAQCPKVGNPCNPGTGIKTQSEMVYRSLGANALTLELIYNSRSPLLADAPPSWTGASAFGKNWVGTYERRLAVLTSGAVAGLRPDGRQWLYAVPGSGNRYVPDADVTDVLDRLVDAGNHTIGWTLTAATGDRLETYDAGGKLLSITDRDGTAQTLAYSDGTSGANGGFVLDASGNPTTKVLPAGLLIRVTDFVGGTLSFGYNSVKRVVKMTDRAGQDFLLTYDADRNLASITFPDSTVRTYHYGETAYTSGASLPNHLTGITDENGVRFATYQYDTLGRAISTEHANGVEKY
ncbi:MAG: DUF6531 domain-containing protein, partial [bacterium]